MHGTLSPRSLPQSASFVILADSTEVVLNSKNSKDEGNGGVIAMGLILLAVIITILIFLRNKRGKASDSRQTDDHQQDELGEPDDQDLKMK